MKKTAESVLMSARENNEPVLVLRAKDKCSVMAIKAYYTACISLGCDQLHLEGINDIFEDFKNWRNNHSDQVRNPD